MADMENKDILEEEETELDDTIFTLVDEEGQEQAFQLLSDMEVDGTHYFAFIPYFENPADSLNDDGDLVVLKGEIVDGEEMLATIDDDEEYEKIGEMFLDQLNDIFEDEE